MRCQADNFGTFILTPGQETQNLQIHWLDYLDPRAGCFLNFCRKQEPNCHSFVTWKNGAWGSRAFSEKLGLPRSEEIRRILCFASVVRLINSRHSYRSCQAPHWGGCCSRPRPFLATTMNTAGILSLGAVLRSRPRAESGDSLAKNVAVLP